MSDRVALYFGCLGGKGHFLHLPGGKHAPHDHPVPWGPGLMDTGLLKNRKVPDVPDGRVHWTAGGRPDLWFAFFWWDRSVDSRGACNSGFYVRGFGPATEARDNVQAAFDFGCAAWPKVVERQEFPLRLVTERPL